MCGSSDSRVEPLKGGRAMGRRDYIDCPHCKQKILCGVCAKLDEKGKSPRKRTPGAVYSALSCRKCAARDGNEVEELRFSVEQKSKRIRELETALREEREKHSNVLNDLKLANEKAMRKEQKTHRISRKIIKKNLMDRLNFLELQVPKSSGMIEPEAVALAFSGNPWIWAHCHILVSKSELFKRVLQNVKIENGYKYLVIRDTTHPIMQTVVKFCYAGSIQFDDVITPEVMLQVSHKYEIPYLKKLCDEELCKELTPENIGRLIKLAKAYEARKLKSQTMDYLKDNFEVMRDTVFESF